MNLSKKHAVGYTATALLALGIGAAGAQGDSTGGSTLAGGSTPAPTVTVTAPGSAVPAVTETVEVTLPAQTVTVGPPEPAVAMPGDGMFQVGVDVKPGTYISKAAESGNCYWARLSGGDGLDSIIDNGNSAGQVLVTIKKSDKFFEANGCSDWTKR